jgi:hypothetical protein
LINDGTGHFPASLEQTVPQPTSTLGVYGVEHVDVNGDGRLDIYVLNFGKGSESGRDAVLLNLGSGNQLFTTVYYPEFPTGSNKDSDGDHPVWVDFDTDGRLDIATSQFAARSFVLHNQTCSGVAKLTEQTPPQVPTGSAFRLKAFDANGDGAPDLWIGLNQPHAGHSLMIGNVPEQESNDAVASANVTQTFPALRTGKLGTATDKDTFRVPDQAVEDGGTFTLQPASGVDLQLSLLDQNGNVLSTSSSGGSGGAEQINLAAGLPNRYLQVSVQGGLGSGEYRLSMTPPAGGGSGQSEIEAGVDHVDPPAPRR